MFDFDVVTGPGPVKPKESCAQPTTAAAPAPAERQPPTGAGAEGQSFLSGDRDAKLAG